MPETSSKRRQPGGASAAKTPSRGGPRQGSASSHGLALRRLATSGWQIPLLLAFAHLLLALLAFNPAPHAGGDNAAYVSLARSLIERGAYLDYWDPALRPHTQYPPVWPTILAGAMLLGARGWVAVKLIVVAFSALGVALSYLWLRRATTPGVALAAGLALAIAPGVLNLSHQELSDVPAWAFTMLALWASTHLAGAPGAGDDPSRETRHGRWLAVTAAAVVAGNFTRAAGLPLVAAALLWLALRRRRRDLAVLAGAFFPLAFLWWLRGRAYGAPGYTSYLWAVDPYQPRLGTIGPADLLQRVADNAGRYAGRFFPDLLFSFEGLGVVAGGVVLALAAAGWARRLRRAGLAEAWVPLYVGLLLVWPFTWAGMRFLLPLLPVLLCYAGEVVRDAARRIPNRRTAAFAGAAAAAALLLAVVPGAAAQVKGNGGCARDFLAGERFPCLTAEYHDFFALARMAHRRLPAGSVALSRKPTIWFAVSGYRSRVYPLSADPDTFFRAAREAGAQYVVFDRIPDLAPRYLYPVLRARRDDFCVVPGLSLPDAAVLRIEPGGPRRPGEPEDSFRICDAPQPSQPAPAR